MTQFQQIQTIQSQKTISSIHAVALLNAGGEVDVIAALKIRRDASFVSKLSTSHGGKVLLQTSKPLEKVLQTSKSDVVLPSKLNSQDAK